MYQEIEVRRVAIQPFDEAVDGLDGRPVLAVCWRYFRRTADRLVCADGDSARPDDVRHLPLLLSQDGWQAGFFRTVVSGIRLFR